MRKLFDGEASAFRGLAYYTDYGRLITTETVDDVVKLIFIDIGMNKDVVKV